MTRLLSEYCLIESLISPFAKAGEKEALWELLSGIFCIGDKAEAAKLFSAACAEPFSDMHTLADYERECRIIEYSAAVGTPAVLDDCDRMLLAAKGEALRYRQDMVSFGTVFGEDAARDELYSAASAGNVRAGTALAILEHFGIGFAENKKRAARLLASALRWNNVEAIFTSLYICPETRPENLGRLALINDGEDGCELVGYISRHYGTAPGAAPEGSALMELAFSEGSVRRELYEHKFASYMYTSLLGKADKRRIALSYKKETAAVYDELPIAEDESDALSPVLSALDSVKLDREGEKRRIRRNLACVHTRRNKFYKPLLIICRDPYVTSMYKNAILSALSSAPAVKIDAALLHSEELANTKENIFFRAVNDTGRATAVVVVENVDELSSAGARELSRYIRGDMRAAFRLGYPQLTLDLSRALPVLFASGEVDESLVSLCDVVRASAVVELEKEAVVKDILDYKRRSYGLAALEVTDEVMKTLVAKSSAQVTDLADELAKYVSCEPDGFTVGADTFDTLMREMKPEKSRFGF